MPIVSQSFAKLEEAVENLQDLLLSLGSTCDKISDGYPDESFLLSQTINIYLFTHLIKIY